MWWRTGWFQMWELGRSVRGEEEGLSFGVCVTMRGYEREQKAGTARTQGKGDLQDIHHHLFSVNFCFRKPLTRNSTHFSK